MLQHLRKIGSFPNDPRLQNFLMLHFGVQEESMGKELLASSS